MATSVVSSSITPGSSVISLATSALYFSPSLVRPGLMASAAASVTAPTRASAALSSSAAFFSRFSASASWYSTLVRSQRLASFSASSDAFSSSICFRSLRTAR